MNIIKKKAKNKYGTPEKTIYLIVMTISNKLMTLCYIDNKNTN